MRDCRYQDIRRGKIMLEVERIRGDFPIFRKNPDVIYFDNASTTQKPICVIDVINEFYANCCSNVGRGSYSWAGKNLSSIKKVREKVARFINANEAGEVVFTTGSTHSCNIISVSWGMENLKSGDEVMICFSDHKSTVEPWIRLKNILARMGVEICLIPIMIHPHGDYDETDLHSKVNDNTKLIVLTHIHNVYGLEMSIGDIVAKVKDKNRTCLVAVDASQSIAHIPVDVKKLGVDFLFFSGHKMFSANGVGILWVNHKIHKKLSIFMAGADIKENRTQNINEKIMEKLYERLETGTLNISSILSLGKAIDYISSLGIDNIERHVFDLTMYLIEKLKRF
jgi:cysteine desulfurase / selenocysteine lyase